MGVPTLAVRLHYFFVLSMTVLTFSFRPTFQMVPIYSLDFLKASMPLDRKVELTICSISKCYTSVLIYTLV